MLFIFHVMRVLPPFFFNGSVVDIMTPYGIKPLLLEVDEATRIRVPDFHAILTFTYKQRRVSYPIVKLLERPRINFAPLPLQIDFSVSRLIEDTDKHTQPFGHRGSGSDVYRKQNCLPYVPENSIHSYKHAYELGANWVELDLSITSDDAIVVHHDYKVGDTPIWSITEKQFKSRVKAPTTFESTFTELNPKINLLIEIKYPSIEEIESEKLGIVPNIQHFTSKIIEIIRKRKNRELILSSFEPDALAYIKKTAPDLDVFLLTEGVPNKFMDQRRNSLEEGIQFGVEHDLQGIITDSEVVSCDPVRYTTSVHSSGLHLILYFYRSLFKETDYVKEIKKFDCAGVDGLIVDDIPMVTQVISNWTSCSYNNLKNNQCEVASFR